MANTLMTPRVWEETVVIPTYEAGEPDKNPMFLEKRVYQGSTGKVYPYPTTEKISREKTDKEYQALFLENEYLKVMILPELGGRIQRAYDKTNDYDFVYYNHVIKPALVGLLGPWISGGIEFNWPQHHRPTTFMPVDYLLAEHADGSKTVMVHDVDQMYATKGMASFTIYPDKAYLEIRGQLYNRTALPQTFLWWANPAVAANEHTQSVFPPDVHSVYDHGKRDVSRFPIATGVYYKHDYSEGVDISRYQNIPVPTSYMAEKSEYDFVGSFDYSRNAGILHVADHHLSPGKKQWTWGCGDFGRAWEQNLTDSDGPYIELMTGVYTDNQPDFTWLKPFEEKTFKQYFMPYQAVGQVKNATINAMVNLEVSSGGKIRIAAYATSLYEPAKVVLKHRGEVIFAETTRLSPADVFETTVSVKEALQETQLELLVYYGNEQLVSYQPRDPGIVKRAEPAKAARDPEEIMTNEELFLTGQHIEQYRHATYLPDPYYLEGLKRDAGDIRLNNAYGLLLLRRGQIKQAEGYFRKALKRLTSLNPNPYNSESYYHLGLSLLLQEKEQAAFDAFFKASWSSEQQEMAYYYLAAIKTRQKDYSSALELIDQALVKNSHNIKARGLKAVVLRKLGNTQAAKKLTEQNLAVDPFDFLSRFEQCFLAGGQPEKARLAVMRNSHENYLMTARDYGESGCYEEAVMVLETGLGSAAKASPMLYYYQGFYCRKLGRTKAGLAAYQQGDGADPTYCFPNKIEDIAVLRDVIKAYPQGAKAYYYLGNLCYDKLDFDQAISLWEASEKLDGRFATVSRNLALGYYNKRKQPEKARIKLAQAFRLDQTDARVFLELDQLYKKREMPAAKRLEHLLAHPELIRQRDDLYTEYCTLLNLTGRHQEAYEAIMNFNFRPWEGAEGRISTQYKLALLELAKDQLAKGKAKAAKEYLEKALAYPPNLGEGRLEGTKDNHLYYHLGLCMQALGEDEAAKRYFERAALGSPEPAGMMYYYDQPADMILYQGMAMEQSGQQKLANARFYRLIDYGEQHLSDEVKIDCFAVSLPDFLIFDEDLTRRNQAHCHYLIGLGKMGLKESAAAKENLERTLALDPSHQNAAIYLKDLKKAICASENMQQKGCGQEGYPCDTKN